MGFAPEEQPSLASVVVALLAHGNQHLGELWLTRTLQGFGGETF